MRINTAALKEAANVAANRNVWGFAKKHEAASLTFGFYLPGGCRMASPFSREAMNGIVHGVLDELHMNLDELTTRQFSAVKRAVRSALLDEACDVSRLSAVPTRGADPMVVRVYITRCLVREWRDGNGDFSGES